jgi:tyrosyl-DNA phosphodiesterase-1
LCQFSSIGSLNKLWLDRFLSAIDSSSTCGYDPIKDHDRTNKGGGDDAPKGMPSPLSSRMKIIWPTVEEIRSSVEGFRGGGAIPGRVANLDKNFLTPLYHRWSSSSNDGGDNYLSLRTARHAPHIKTYVQPADSDPNAIEWLVLTSHNLSIAAWGQLQKTSVQGGRDDRVLFMSNWELGVFMSPATLINAISPDVADDKHVRMVSYSSLLSSVINVDGDDENDDSNIILPIPYDINPTPYNASDVFWAVDRDYTLR